MVTAIAPQTVPIQCCLAIGLMPLLLVVLEVVVVVVVELVGLPNVVNGGGGAVTLDVGDGVEELPVADS